MINSQFSYLSPPFFKRKKKLRKVGRTLGGTGTKNATRAQRKNNKKKWNQNTIKKGTPVALKTI